MHLHLQSADLHRSDRLSACMRGAAAQLSLRALMCRRAPVDLDCLLGFSCCSIVVSIELEPFLFKNHIPPHLSSDVQFVLDPSLHRELLRLIHLHCLHYWILRRKAKGGNGDTQTSGDTVPRGGRAGCRAGRRRRGLVQGHRHVLRRQRRFGHNGYVPS